MEHRNRYDGVHPRAIQFVRYRARQLARHRVVPGMELDDYEQDLIADLLTREHSFDAARAGYPTFADRIIRHRVSTLNETGARMRRVELGTAARPSLEPQEEPSGDPSWTEDRCSLCLDLERFLERLPVRLRRCCSWLLADNRLAAAAALGLHRSSLYEAAQDLRRHAIEAGLHLYLQADSTPTPPIPTR